MLVYVCRYACLCVCLKLNVGVSSLIYKLIRLLIKNPFTNELLKRMSSRDYKLYGVSVFYFILIRFFFICSCCSCCCFSLKVILTVVVDFVISR